MFEDNVFLGEYNYERAKQWCVDHEGFLLKSVGIYLISIFSIKYLMKDRKPLIFSTPLIWWNAALALFSILGFLRMTPTMFKVIYEHGFSCKL